MRRVVWLTTSLAVPPGLLSAEAWRELAALPVCAAPTHPQAAALAGAGITVRTLTDAVPAAPATQTASTAAVPATASTASTRAGALPATDCVWLAQPGEEGLRAELEADPATTLELLVGSWAPPGGRLVEAVAVMDRLRSPGGCPWDAEQTHASLAPYLLEETYEAYQAIEDGDLDAGLREELGDVLLQVLFHARLAEERSEPWSVDDVAGGLVDKLVGRHPHVFAAGAAVSGALTVGEVERNWDAIKRAEKGRTSVVDGVALGQPALSLAAKLLGRASKAGLPTALPDPEPGADGAELVGRSLFGVAARARAQGIDPEAALRAVARAYAVALQTHEADAD